MKKYLYFLTMTVGLTAVAQEFKGVAVYGSVSTHKNAAARVSEKFDPAMQERMKEALSKPVERQYTLYFDKTISVFEEDQKLSMDSPNRRVSAGIVSGKTYHDLKNNFEIEEREIFGKEFLVTDTLQKREWKLENETKKIGSYTCYKATYTIKRLPSKTEGVQDKAINLTGSPEEMIVTAWYAPEIPVNHGPGGYWGLPGLILSVSNDNITLLCSKLTLNPKEVVELKMPNKGEKITEKEFRVIMAKKLEEMKEMRSPDRRH
ncbi:GLPGLI family protein [Flavobacterium sp.]|uniref:GLPGLI family protein n=1 Tax=Flavobacterium sp. TaxID=239 RepID=UPI004034E399